MYTNLIQDDIIVLDNEFFKINMMFETVNKMYDIKQRELEYNYIYTESINEEYIDLYTEAEEAKDRKEQGLLGRLFTAILNFIRKIRAKILRLFGNDKKAAELEAKIKGNPKLANQTVEITNTTDAEKAIDEGTSFFAGLINKIVGGTATEADADAAEEKNKSLLSRIAIFGGGALLAAGGAKVASDKLKERGVTKQTIKETVSNLLKREEDTKKKSNKVTQTNEQNVQKAQQAMNNNSQSGNEENTKAGRRIVSSFKDFITDAGKFFTGKASELKSKINGVSSNNNDDNTGDNKGSSKSSNNRFDFLDADIEKNDVGTLRERIGNIIYTSMDFSSGDFDAAIKYVESKGIKLKEPYNNKPELILNKKDLSECTVDDFRDAVFELKENFCTERINEVKKIGKYRFGPGGKAKNNDDKKKDSTKDEQEEQIQPKTNTSEPSKTQKNEQDEPEDKVEKHPETKSDNKDHELSSKEKIDGEIRRLLNKFSNYVYFNSPSLLTLSPMKQYVEKGFSIVSPEDQPKANFQVIDEIFDFEPETIVKVAKRILDSYSIYSKYKNPDKNKVEEALKNQLRYNKIDYSDVDREMDDIKTTFTTLDKYAKELNELIKKRETFKESSYDIINDILTIFENSF